MIRINQQTSLMRYLISKKTFFVVEAIPVFLLVLLKLLISKHEVFKSFELPVLLIIIGLPFAYVLRNYIRITCLFHWYVIAAASSLIFVPFVFLFLGFLKINIVFVHCVSVVYLLGFLSCVLLIIFGSKKEIDAIPFLSTDWKFNLLGIAAISLVIISFTLKNFRVVDPGWDTFTFWGLDANYIFQFNKLRDASFTTAGNFHYTSLFPILFSITYKIFGKITEQYATWINIYILGVSAFQVLFLFSEKKLFWKLLGLSVLLLTMIGAGGEAVARVFNFYSDVYCAFLLLQFAIFLTNKPPESTENYKYRLLIIGLPLIGLFFVKNTLLVLIVFFFLVYLIHDLWFVRGFPRSLLKSKAFYISLSVLLLLVLLRAIYFSAFPQVAAPMEAIISKSGKVAIPQVLRHMLNILRFFAEKSPLLSGVWLFHVIIFLVSTIAKKTQKAGIAAFTISLFGFLFFVGGYAVKLIPITSRSLARYTSIVMFVVPMTLSYINLEFKKKHIRWMLNAVAGISLLMITVYTANTIARQLPITISSGVYSETKLSDYYQKSKMALAVAGEQAAILIADEAQNGATLTNSSIPGIYYRYYLMNNSVGGQYSGLKNEDLINFGAEQGAEYLLLISYDNFFDQCGLNLDKEVDYLIKMPELHRENSIVCPINRASVIPLP